MQNIVELPRGTAPSPAFIQLRDLKSKAVNPRAGDRELARFNKQMGQVRSGITKPVVIDGLDPKYVENWSGVAGSIENARTIGFEDMQRTNATGAPTIRRGDVVVTDKGDHYLIG